MRGWSAGREQRAEQRSRADYARGAQRVRQRAVGLWPQRPVAIVAVVVVPLSEPTGAAAAQVPIRFTQFRSALASTQAFDAATCSPAPGRIGAWFDLDAPNLLGATPGEAAGWQAEAVFSLAGRRDSALASSAFPSGPERRAAPSPAHPSDGGAGQPRDRFGLRDGRRSALVCGKRKRPSSDPLGRAGRWTGQRGSGVLLH